MSGGSTFLLNSARTNRAPAFDEKCAVADLSPMGNADSVEPRVSPRGSLPEPGPYRKYYPKEVRHQRATHQFVRSCSLQPHQLAGERGSPVRKKSRSNHGIAADSFLSLPIPLKGLERATCTIPETSPEADPSPGDDHAVRDETTVGKLDAFLQHQGNAADSDWESAWRAESSTTSANVSKRTGLGPITAAVISRGFRAKVRSLSSWFINDSEKSCESVAGWPEQCGSMPSSVSFAGSLRRFGSPFRFGSLNLRKRKRPAFSTASDQATSTGSLNSLGDGRTPWPVPWLEAIFLPEYPNKSPVNEKSFCILGTIANGAFGKVYRVCLKTQSATIFAMKVQNKSDIIAQNAIQQMKDEVSIHESVGQCCFIAELYASWQSRTKLYTVLQYATGYGDLYELMRDEGPFQNDVVQLYSAEIALALGHVQLVDFGLAKWLGIGDRTRTICGTLDYMAPEVAQCAPYDHAVDWWSFGVLIYILLTGCRPFPAAQHHRALRFDSYASSATICPEAHHLLSRLMCADAESRLKSLAEFQQQPFFQAVDFDRVADKQIHPFDYIPRMRSCLSCNKVNDGDLDTLEQQGDLTDFQEQYQPFSDFDYFHDDMGY